MVFPASLKSTIRGLIISVSGTFFLFVLLITGVIARLLSIRRRETIRVVSGPTPILAIKYWSQAIQKLGYNSSTVVFNVYPNNSRTDFDFTAEDFRPHTRRLGFLKPYFMFIWVLFKFDVLIFFFDGGFLAQTPLAFFECQLLRLAGKKIIVMPIGSDVAVAEYLGVFLQSMRECYPQLIACSELTKKRVLYFSRWADFIIKNMQVGFVPRYDLLWPNCFAIDVSRWNDRNHSSADGHHSEVIVVHSSNHRAIKGTDALIQAVEELRAEGLKIRLELMEERSNEEVRKAVSDCDILAEQFIGGYAMSAIEGMSAGKPVLSHLSWQGKDIREIMELEECPIVDTPMDQIKQNLKKLAENPQLRHELGRAGREYVMRYHSYEAVGKRWDSILRHVWLGEPLFWHGSARKLAA